MELKRIAKTLLTAAFAVVAYQSTAQNLTVQNLQSEAGKKAMLTVNLSGASVMTALQFNLTLPEGVTIADDDMPFGSAVADHTLNVQPLISGDRMFVVYSMNLNTFNDGDLLHIPVTIGNDATTGEGSLSVVRMSTTEAVSQTCEDVAFTVTINSSVLSGDINGDGVVDVSDYIGIANYILGQTQEGFNEEAADVNGDGEIDVSDYIGVANIILTGSPYGNN